MYPLTRAELEESSEAIEAAIDATDGIDPWCSGPDWALSVSTGFAPRGKHLYLQSSDGHGFALFGYYRDLQRNILLSSIEPLWGFACPLFGVDIDALAAEVAADLDQLPHWSSLIIPGLPPLPHPTALAVSAALGRLGPISVGEGITRRVADLSDGYEAWLDNRSARFRRNLRQAERRAVERGLKIVDVTADGDGSDCDHDPGSEPFDRLLAIEHESWKGSEGSGMTSDEMSAMYRFMVDRLRQQDRLQVFVARLDDHDVGYILGGIRNHRYRGLQISYRSGYDDLSIGNLLQLHQIRHLCRHELAHTYDMGMDFGYKQRWADRAETSITAVIQRA